MALDYGLAFTNQPQVQAYPTGAALLSGMQTGQQMALQHAQTQNAELNNTMQRMQLTNSLFGSVAFAPPEQQEAVYNQNLKTAKAYGLDTSGLPPTWGPEAQSAVQAGYYNSGLAMQKLKMDVEMGMLGSLVNYRNSEVQKNNSDIQKNSFETGGYTSAQTSPTLNAGSGTGATTPYFNPTVTPTTGQLPTPQSAGIAPGQAGYGQQVVNQNTNAPMLSATPGISAKAELEKQTAQGKDFQDWLYTAANADKNYLQTKQAIDTLRPLINKQTGLSNTLPGITGNIELALRDPDAKIMEQAGHNLNVQYIGNTAASMKGSRMDIPIVRAIQVQAISPTNRQESNEYELNRNQTANELNHALSQYAPVINASGVRDPNTAQTIFTNAILKSGGITKDGRFDQGKFETWPQYLPQNLKQAFYQTHPEMVRPDLDAKFIGTYNGKPLSVSYEQIIEAADKYHMPPLDYMKSLNLQPVNPPQQISQQPQQQQVQQQPISLQQGQNVPRGIRNNNPGNIERTSQAWNGEIQGNDSRFKTFSSPQAGINGISTLLNKYATQGKNTIADIVKTWAPPNENNTVGYIRDVAQKTGFNPFQKLDLSNPMVKGAIVKALIQHENGGVPYSDNMIFGSL